MPYVKKGTDVFKQTGHGMKLVGHSSKNKVEGYLRALRMVEHGVPMKNKRK